MIRSIFNYIYVFLKQVSTMLKLVLAKTGLIMVWFRSISGYDFFYPLDLFILH